MTGTRNLYSVSSACAQINLINCLQGQVVDLTFFSPGLNEDATLTTYYKCFWRYNPQQPAGFCFSQLPWWGSLAVYYVSTQIRACDLFLMWDICVVCTSIVLFLECRMILTFNPNISVVFGNKTLATYLLIYERRDLLSLSSLLCWLM